MAQLAAVQIDVAVDQLDAVAGQADDALDIVRIGARAGGRGDDDDVAALGQPAPDRPSARGKMWNEGDTHDQP